MFANSKSDYISNKNGVFNFIIGLIISIILSLGLVVLFAFLLKWFDIPEGSILPVTFGIKYISVIIGSFVAVRGTSKGLIKGAFFGILYTLSAFLIFSFLSKSFSVDLTTLLDLISSILLGSIVGIIKVNKGE